MAAGSGGEEVWFETIDLTPPPFTFMTKPNSRKNGYVMSMDVSRVISYKNCVHVLNSSSKKHYTWNGRQWSKCADMPFDVLYSSWNVVVYDNKIYIYGVRNTSDITKYNYAILNSNYYYNYNMLLIILEIKFHY